MVFIKKGKIVWNSDFFSNLDLFQILPWKKTKSHASSPTPTQNPFPFLGQKEIFLHRSDCCLVQHTDTHYTWQKKCATGLKWKVLLLGDFLTFLYPQWPVFLRPLDTACSAKEQDVQSFLSVCLFWDKNLGSSDLPLLCGYVTNGVKSVCEISEILFLCWWAALYVVCMHAAWHEYLVIHFVFES